MQCLEVSGVVRLIHRSLGVKGLILNFLDRFSKNTQISNFLKIRQMGAELFHVGRRTEGRTGKHDNANISFLKFCERA